MEVEAKKQQSNVKVAVRVRPLSYKEVNQGDTSVINTMQNSVVVAKSSRQFNFDHVFNSQSSQQEIFEQIGKGLVHRCLEGYNSTILAYGQTGSGKTFTMGTTGVGGLSNEQQGLIPRVIYYIFEQLGTRTDVTLKVSYLEIYNEQIIDLLDSKSESNLQIREEKDQSISIPGLTEESVATPQQMLVCLDKGGLNRTTASTNMNERSSRSHAIYTIHFEIAQEESFITAKFHFVDLAGSERLKKTMAVGQVMAEGISINQSLLKLGNVISLLSEKCKQRQSKIHIPYRESKLTRLLQDSLGGNANTFMVACVSPAESNYEETLNSLKYASRAREIENTPTINRDPQSAMIQAFKDQINQLQAELASCRSLLKQNNIKFVEGIKFSLPAQSTMDDQQETLKRLNMSLKYYEKQVMILQAEVNSHKKSLSESEISLYTTRRQRDQFSVELQAAKDLLKSQGMVLPEVDPTPSQFEEYEKQVDLLRRQLQERDKYTSQLQLEYDQLLKDQKRDQKIIFEKMQLLDRLKRDFINNRQRDSDHESEEAEDVEDDPIIKQRKDQFEEACKNCETELEMVSQQILEKEGILQSMALDNYELKSSLAQEMKLEYYQQIQQLEAEKQQLQKQCDVYQSKMNSLDQSERNQVHALKNKVQQMESKISEMRQKDNNSKMLQKKMEEQDRQLTEMKTFIERMKKQKLDLQRKLKEEGDKFMKFKDERYKEVMMARKQKLTTDAQVRKLKNEKQKIEYMLKKKEDELSRHKQDQRLSSKRVTKNNSFKESEQSVYLICEQYLRGKDAERQLFKENEKIYESLNLQGIEQGKVYKLEIKREQLIYDITRLQSDQHFDSLKILEVKQSELNQIEMDLIQIKEQRDSIDETMDYQRKKIYELQDINKKAQQALSQYLDSLQGVPGQVLKTIKYMVDCWATQRLIADELKVANESYIKQIQHMDQQIQYLTIQNQARFIDEERMDMSPEKRPKQPVQINQVQEDLTRQLNDQRRKYQQLQNEYREFKKKQEYTNTLLAKYKSLNEKDKFIGVNKIDENQVPAIVGLKSVQACRDKRKMEQQQQKQLGGHRSTPSDHKLPKQRPNDNNNSIKRQVSDFDEDQFSDHENNINISLENKDLKWELVRSFQPHDHPVLSVTSVDNVLYSTAFKQLRVWNLEAQTLISSIDFSGYVRAACYWEERKAIAVAHGSQILLYDQNSLMPVGSLKCGDEVRVLTKHNGCLIAGGKGTPTNGAVTVWDNRQNNPLFEFDKGQDVFSMHSFGQNLYWGTRTHNVRYTSSQFTEIGQMDPPHYDRVTGLGSMGQWLVSCSAGKDMRMWSNKQSGRLNSDIHKEVILTMTTDPSLQLIYTGCKDGQIKVSSIAGDRFIQVSDITASTLQINSITNIQNNCIVSGGADKLLKIWKPNQVSNELLQRQRISDILLEDI